MKRVGVYTSSLLPYSETFIAEQTRALQRWRPVLLGERRLADGLPLDGLDAQFLYAGSEPRSRLRRLCRWAGRPYPAALGRLRGVGAQLVHVHFGTNAVDVWPLVRALHLPMLVTLHGYDINIHPEWWEAGNGGPLRRAYPRQLRRLARNARVRFVAVSEAIRERAVAYGLPGEKVVVCPVGVDTLKFRPAGLPLRQRRNRVLFVGRLVENKGVACLIQALAAVRRHCADVELVVVGDGSLKGSLETLARELAVAVRFRGATDSAGVRAELAEARILCLPSLTVASGESEGFGLVLLEAQACGVPVLTSSRGAATHGLLEGVTGHSFAEGDVAGLARNLVSLLQDPGVLERMSLAGPGFVREHYELRRLTERLEQEYDRMLEGVASVESERLAT